MNILILGPQGSGKGTQARLIVDTFNLFYVSIGDILRDLAKSDPAIKEKIDNGILLPDDEMFGIVTKFLKEKNISGNILFDGYPRNIGQYQLLKSWLSAKGDKIDLAIVLNISEEETVRRLSARRLDAKTGKIYNLITDLPGPEVNISTLIQRDDDKPAAIMKRLEVYKSSTLPLIDLLRKDTKIVEISGERSIEEISKELIEIVRKTSENQN